LADYSATDLYVRCGLPHCFVCKSSLKVYL